MTIQEFITALNNYPFDTEIQVYNVQGEWADPPEIENWFYNQKQNLLIIS